MQDGVQEHKLLRFSKRIHLCPVRKGQRHLITCIQRRIPGYVIFISSCNCNRFENNGISCKREWFFVFFFFCAVLELVLPVSFYFNDTCVTIRMFSVFSSLYAMLLV